ncbi:glyoxalase [Peteryoungia desertarenae]|uniref:Bleomycin resistance protein n=1 Tax=Peteryoungia desertarenae TaxID=1813451 RepID=A0ABX6QQZ0_9HYPH|nr:glyoxalase superfamily protein [Peteryoungia desertarenae]QLF71066.1 glyoxalase [Peteryoungia desertarenae]
MDRADLTPDRRMDIVPVLPSLDFAQTSDFYRSYLGFEEMPFSHDDYMIIRRGCVELHFSLTHDPGLCHASSVIIRFPDVRQIYDALRGRGIDVIRPSVQGPGGQVFHLRDPHGLLLIFADGLGQCLANGHGDVSKSGVG